MNTAPRNQVLYEYFKQKLTASSKHVYSPSDLASLIAELRADFGFPQSISVAKFQRSLIENGIVQEILFTATYPFESKRYHLVPFSPYELALSLRSGSYLSHGTAAYLHKLSDQTHRTIYLNKEQSPKDSTTTLTQAGINRAFMSRQRESAYIVTHDRTKITLLNGKHSDRLGVIQSTGPAGEQIELTDLERTLIDIAVRPAYAGGPKAVLEAYRRARSKTSVPRLAKMLAELEYVYPYHQAIGFYLQNAGHSLTVLKPLLRMRRKFDFFLVHAMRHTRFDPHWQIYFPDNLSDSVGGSR
jgi:hypothetical protein